MKFELKPVKEIPKTNRKRKNKLKHDELEIEYMKRITGRENRPALRK